MTSQTRPPRAKLPAILRGDRQRRLLTEPVIFEEGSLPPFLRMALAAALLLSAAFALWMTQLGVDDVAVARGQVMPAGPVKAILAPEDGTVAEVPVAAGQLVAEGDVLLRLEPSKAVAQLDKLKAQLATLNTQAGRLRAVAAVRRKELPADQQAALKALDRQTAQRRKDLVRLQEQLADAERQADIAREQLKIGLETRRRVAKVEDRVIRLREQIRQINDNILQSQRWRGDLKATEHQDVVAELAGVTNQVDTVNAAIQQVRQRIAQMVVRAPASGVVQGSSLPTAGDAVAAGAVLMRLVPVGDSLTAEIRFPPSEAGRIRAGQTARIKVLSFDPARFGTVDGTVARVLPTAFLDGQDRPYYTARITLAGSWLGAGDARTRLLPGMAVEADVVTGRRPLFDYLFRPSPFR